MKEDNKYNMKGDFVNLAIIISLIIIVLGTLYFYDQQSHILKTVAEQATTMF